MSFAKTHRILVVDDLLDNLLLLQTVLEAEGYQVDVADSGRAALAQVEASPPDLILLDVMMPDLDGYEVTRRIRQKSALDSLPILLVTAHDEMARRSESAKVNGFIRKPLDFDRLLDQVKAVLSEPPQKHHPFWKNQFKDEGWHQPQKLIFQENG